MLLCERKERLTNKVRIGFYFEILYFTKERGISTKYSIKFKTKLYSYKPETYSEHEFNFNGRKNFYSRD